MNYFRCGGGRSTHTATKITVAKTPLATFQSNVSGLYLPEIIAYIQATQSGSGDPSPINPRAINGVTQVDTTRTGKNLVDETSIVQGAITNSGQYDGSVTTRICTDYIRVTASTDYVATVGTGFKVVKVHYYDINKVNNTTYTLGGSSELQFTTRADSGYIRLVYGRTNDTELTPSVISEPQCELGNTATTYQPYTGTTATTALGGTYYGGYLNVPTGLLTGTHEMVDMGTINWSFITGRGWSTTDLIGVAVLDYNNPSFIAEQWRTHGWTGRVNGDITCNSGGAVFCVTTDNVNQPQGKMVYELATPQTVQLTPAQIEQLLWQNNVFCSSGDVAVKYWKID